MTHDELLELIADGQQLQSELDDVEVKSARGGTPQRLYEPLSAFANRTGGGVILFGLDESHNFEIVGVGNAHRLQEEISHLANADMEPALRPEFTVEEIEGKTVVAVEVFELAAALRPCFYRPAGLQRGSYIRVGNTNRLMTDYEIFGYVSARTQPTFDEEPIRDATIENLDRLKLEDYLTQLKRTRPYATYLNLPFEQVLSQLHVVREVDGVLRPTLAGLLMFGKYPQEFEIQMVITFLQYFGTTETEATPRGERFLDNRKFEGTIPEIVDSAVNQVLANIRKSSLIEGVFRQDIPEYPERAVREAIVNAIAHRDYSHFVRGSYIQIRLFADRLEIQSPGGLYGNVTEDTIENEQSTRNRLLMRMMEDLHLVENRGSGIRSMLEAMRQANLEPPRFQDRRSSFWVTFRNHTLMSPPAIAWLNQFAGLPLNDHQRLALVYLRHNEQMTNSDYQRLNHVDSVTANRELRGLVQADLTKQHSTRRWAYYTLNLPAEEKVTPPSLSNEEKILAYVREHGSISNSECRDLLRVGMQRASHLLKKMQGNGLLKREGGRRWARYVLP
ncbi:putative DNA binding domain-containing protein [candidate division KSB1 bacterium]|nr:putative DNA binding domain-containing protein [candidate division KSB1 bacterium]